MFTIQMRRKTFNRDTGAAVGGLAVVGALILLFSGCPVTPPELESVSVSPGNPTVKVGESITFSASGVNSDGSSEKLTSGVTWSSSVEAVAAIDSAGSAEALTTGTTTITAAYEGLTGTSVLTVEPYNPELGTWQTAGTFSQARRSHSSAVYNDVLYLAGGIDAGLLSSVVYSAVSPDGSIGNWADATAFAGDGRSNHGGFAYGGYLYAMGGFATGGVVTSDVLRAEINPDGSLGSCETEANSLLAVKRNFSVVEYNGFVYVTG